VIQDSCPPGTFQAGIFVLSIRLAIFALEKEKRYGISNGHKCPSKYPFSSKKKPYESGFDLLSLFL